MGDYQCFAGHHEAPCCEAGQKLLLARPNEGMRRIIDGVKKISSYVDELSEVEDPPRMAKCWMNEARGLSYDMEDYIDSSLLVQPAGSSLVATDKEAIAVMVSEFSKYVQKAIERHKVYALPDSAASSALRRRFVSLGLMLPTSYEDIIIDRRMKEFIKSFAEDGDKQLKVVSLLGPACLGKTTLATVLYSKLGKRYHCRAFIRVSRKPDTKRIFRDMLWQLRRQDPPEYRYEVELIDNIKKYLRNKRYLIIIDDLWAASVWDTINDALPKGGHGSRIVTTTQIEDVALTCCSHQPQLVFEMQPLDEDHSRELFFNRLFGSESGCLEIFKEVSNEIVEMCGGLPLATISIASLLASQLPVITEGLLEHIRDSLSLCFSASERTRQALNLSFNNLPHYLKTCLLCFGMYREVYTFRTDDLVKQWIAEGFIDTTEGQDAEKVAESYLHQLIGRRFIQPICINYNNEVLSCAVHDTVHDLIAHKSAEENFIVAIDYSQKNVALSRKARRLSLLFGDEYAKIPPNITKSQLRTLNFFGVLECMPCITEYKLLRVLVLQISGHDGEDNPVDLTGISELIHLRYLKIGCGICIKLKTDGLKCLETLDITDAIVDTYSGQINLPSLLHLNLPSDANYPGDITRILGIAGRLYSLEDIYVTGSSTDFVDLEKNNEYLGSFINKHGNLRTVVFSHRSTVKTKGFCRSIKVINPKPSKEVITYGAPLLQRFECLPASGIAFSRTPIWVKELQNLCILKITVKIVEMNCVGILSRLRALTALSLYVQWQSAERIIFDKTGFLALKYFKLRYITGLAWIKFEAAAMPNLLKLRLVFNVVPRIHPHFVWNHSDKCEQYKHGNALIIIEHMPSLREISAKFGGAAADLKRIEGITISNDESNPDVVDSSSLQQEEIQEKEPADETLDRAAAERTPESLHVFTLDELISATSNFSRSHFVPALNNKINLNRRRFCCPGVYEGSFDGNLRQGLERQEIVVKCINKSSDEHEWLMVHQTELENLVAVRHPNLVKLLGFCDYNEHRMLVYEYMPRTTTLTERLSIAREEDFPWLMRLNIAVGTAKALAFLHEAEKPMVHGNLEASSILLDLDCTAKLFGYRWAEENSRDKTPGRLRAENDVYNFGVVLLQLLTGQNAVVQIPLVRWLSFEPKEYCAGRDLVEWWRPYLSRQDKLCHIIDPRLEGKYSGHAVWSTATIVRRCLHGVPEKRSSMRDVVEALEPLLLLVNDDKPSSQTKDADNEARDNKAAGGSNVSKSSQLDVNWQDSCKYPPEWGGRHKFTLDELMSATSNFSKKNLLGEADFGHIYKGTIDGKLMVAVMKLRPDCDDWLVQRAWLPDLQHLESMRQPHLVRLLGYCGEDDQCVLVYEYMSRGSLSEINLMASIPWLTRLEIAVGAAKGLTFLHETGKQMIYYTGFTASSILLDSDYRAKLWGFGLAKQSYLMRQVIMRTDVYNFGVVLLELLAGRPTVEHKGVDQTTLENWLKGVHQTTLENWLKAQLPGLHRLSSRKQYRGGSYLVIDLERVPDHIMHPSLGDQYSVRTALSTAKIACWCLQSDPENRPSMREVVEALCTTARPYS